MAAQELEPHESTVPQERMPRHIGIIMDGNGRWARNQGLAREKGHERGADSVRAVVRAARKLGVEALTLFAFSAQNWDRPPQEVFHLMQLLRRYLIEERSEILDNGIKLQTVGETDRLPGYVQRPLRELMRASEHNTGMVLCLALSYGGRETLAATARKLAEDVAKGKLKPKNIDTQTFEAALPSHGMPALDLLVRTSGERRISNFFLWEAAYAELYFTECMWPEFGRPELVEAIEDFAGRERRFGLTSEQTEPVSASAT